MTTVSAADMLGNDVIREEILQKLRENAARLQQEGTTLPPQASQDLISISDEARRRLEEQKAAAGLPQTTEQTEQPQPGNQTAQTAEEPPLLSGESPSGVRVDISAAETAEGENAAPTYHAVLNGKDGSSFTLNFSGSVSIAAGEDGLWSVYHADLGVTRLYGSDGSYTETAGNMLDPDGDIIVISTGADELTLGDGDNLVFALGDDAVITAGNGDNTVHVAGSNVSVTTGDGDDHIIVTDDAEGATISTGNGNDSLKAENLHGATVDLGDGDNTLQAGSITASDISMGNGKNVITGSGENCTAIDNSRVSLGDGDNILRIGLSGTILNLGQGNNVVILEEMTRGSSLTAGQGDNTITASQWIGDAADSDISDSLIALGDGKNEIVLGEATKSNITLGNGDNLLSLTGVRDGLIMLGDGNNDISITGNGAGSGTLSQSYLSWGKGDNTLAVAGVSMSAIVGGDGNNVVAIGAQINSDVTLGHGSNRISISSMSGYSLLRAGDGRNWLTVGGMSNNAGAILGHGNNSVLINTIQNSAGLTVGDGDNFILVTEMRDNAYIKAGKGNNIIHVLSAESRDIDVSVDGSYDGVLVNYTYRDVVRNAAGNLTGSANASLEDLLAAALDRLEQAETRRRNETMEDITEERPPATIDERATEATQRASEASQEAVERAEAA